ncbi:MAG: MBOAT family protein, partial [Candidatus Delongbacteria bacterium]
MLFQSLPFLIFFSLFFFVYWSLQSKVYLRNLFLLAGSIYLYSLWDYRFTFLLVFMILVNYFFGRYASKSSLKGKAVFYLCLAMNLIPLLFFKYYNFFTESINDLFFLIGSEFNIATLHFLLPVGISFYTFLSVSYLIDVYKNQIEPETSFVRYAISISYFPIILSGPIHRPRYLLKQLGEVYKFDYKLAVEGLRQILTGLFYKVVIADSIARYADRAFSGYENLDGFSLLLGSVYFSFQLYFDFNGYSEMAIGISKL